MQSKTSTQRIVLCALFAALMAVFSQISIPIGMVPINLAMLAVFIAGGLLGPTYGALSIIVYVVLGAIGVPVFAMFTGGIGILTGPTGGYIVGYVASAWLTGLIISKWGYQPWKMVLAMVAGLILCYALGTAWYMFSMNSPLTPALMACVVPFLPGDAVKIALATFVVRALRKRLAW